MNNIEYKLAGVADTLRRVDDFSRVEVKRVRDEAYTDDNGEEQYKMVLDDIGMGDKAAAIVDGEAIDERGAPRAYKVFSLQLLKDISPRELADHLADDLADALKRAIAT